MTKEQAIQALKDGYKVTHRYFTDEEWVIERNGSYIDEQGLVLSISDFWKYRQAEWYNDGWDIFGE